jgi:ABC-2 type transport system permease protein
MCAPVRKYELLTGNVAGSIVVTIVQGLVVILFSKFVLKANWGEDILTVALLLLTYSIMTVSLGAGLAFMFENSEAAMGVLNTIIPIFVFLGGGYVPLNVMSGVLAKISDISPVKWVNSALLSVIYDGNYSRVLTSVSINLAIAAAFIVIASLFTRKGKRLYA